MKKLIYCIGALCLAQFSISQSNSPDVAWRYHDISDDVADGAIIEAVPGSDPARLGQQQTFEESGEEWWYDIQNIYESGIHTGYIVCGFATWVDIQFDETLEGGCEENRKGIEWETKFGSDCYRPVVTGEAISSKLMTLTKYDLNGNMIWCKSYCYAEEGAISVIQTNDGGFVFTGWGATTRTKEGDIIPYNPYEGESLYDPAASGCGYLTTKMLVGKVDSEGDLLWLNQYAYADIGDFSLDKVLGGKSIGYDVIERPYDSDDDDIYDAFAYRVVGRCKVVSATESLAESFYKVLVIDIDENGYIIQKALIGQEGYSTDAREIDTDGTDFYIAGFQSYDEYELDKLNFDALLFKIDEDMNQVDFANYTWDGDAGSANKAVVRYTAGSNNIGFDVKVLDNGKIAWAFLDNCNGCTSSGDNFAHGKINLYDISDPMATVFIDLGAINTYGFTQVHAFDLKIGLTTTQDGGFAAISTFQEFPINPAIAPYNSILTNLHSQITDRACTAEVEYWNSNAYVAKFDGNGTFMWDKSFDADPTSTFVDYPGDWKNQECVYRITEGDDGSLVFVGNTSHNKDDYYIAKINSDCGIQKLNNDGYDLSGYPVTHETIIGSNTTWNEDYPGDNKSLVGTVTVQTGNTLTIDGITMQFADSRKMDITTTIIVEQGAKLRLINGAKLTSITDCENSMWDGVQIRGARDERQISANQGILEMDNSTIENAIIGVSCVGRYGYTVVPEYAGGILKITNSFFKNNLISVEMRPTKNKDVYGDIIDNASYIRNTEFLIDGPLNDIEIANATQIFSPSNGLRRTEPRAHQEFILLDGIQGLRVEGSDFVLEETYGNTIKVARKGYGILAWNSSVKVNSISAYYGDPSPDLNHFENLWVGIYSKPMGGTANSTIAGTVFDNNHIGVAFNGAVTNSKIVNNTFLVRENSVFLAGDADLIHANTGVYLRLATGITIEQNVFDGIDQNNMSVNTGVYVEDSYLLGGTAEIYRNSFESFDITIQSSDDNKQLFVDCNSFDNDITAGDVITWHNATSGLIPNQGSCGLFDPEAPQANAFVGTYTGTNYQILNQGSIFDYNSFTDAIYTVTNYVNLVSYPCPGETFTYQSEACPNKTVSGDLPTLMSLISGLNNHIAQLTYQIDTSSSNTDDLAAELQYYNGKKSRVIDYAVRSYLDSNNYNGAIALLESQNSVDMACELLPLLVERQLNSKLDSTLVFIRDFANIDSTSQKSSELYAVCDFYELIFAIHTQSGGIDSTTNGQIAELQDLVDNNSAIAYNAGNVLEYLELKEFEPLLLRPISTGSSQKPNTVPTEEIIFSKESNLIDFDLFPNPATNEVTISYNINESAQLVIYDVTGRILYNSQVNPDQNRSIINLENFTNGVYLVKLTTTTGQSAIKKLIVQ